MLRRGRIVTAIDFDAGDRQMMTKPEVGDDGQGDQSEDAKQNEQARRSQQPPPAESGAFRGRCSNGSQHDTEPGDAVI